MTRTEIIEALRAGLLATDINFTPNAVAKPRPPIILSQETV
jgi:hypothetical protein